MIPDKESENRVSYFTFIQKKWALFAEQHDCGLIDSLKSFGIENELIDSGIFIKWRRKMSKLVMLSENHPYTKRLFKSITEREGEKTRHMVKYRGMLHPFSLANLYLNFFMALVYLHSMLFVIPGNWAFVRYYVSFKWYTFAIDMLVTLNIIMNFFIGYFDKDLMRIQLSPRRVMRKYLKTYFFFDLLSCVPSYLIGIILAATGPTYLNLVKWLMAFRLARIITIENTLDLFRLYYGFSAAAYVSLQILLKTAGVIVLCAGMVIFFDQMPYVVEYISEQMDYYLARRAIYRTVMAMFGVGKVSIFYTKLEALKFFLISILSIVLQMWILSKLYTIWERYLIASEIGEDHMQQLGSFLKYKALPTKTGQEIYCYFNFKYQKNFYDEPTIINMQSENLKKEIANFKVSRGIEKLKFIKALPHHIVMTIITNMGNMYYSPGDIVFKSNIRNSTLYYINHGSVALFDENNVEICHLEDDSYYGDISVIIPQIRTVTMMAISPCDISTVTHHQLMEILHPFPDLKERVFEATRQILLTRKTDWLSNISKPVHVSITTIEIKEF